MLKKLPSDTQLPALQTLIAPRLNPTDRGSNNETSNFNLRALDDEVTSSNQGAAFSAQNRRETSMALSSSDQNGQFGN